MYIYIYLSTYFQVSFADLWNSAFNLPIMAVRFLSRYCLNNPLCSIRVKSMNTLFCAISMLNTWEQWALHCVNNNYHLSTPSAVHKKSIKRVDNSCRKCFCTGCSGEIVFFPRLLVYCQLIAYSPSPALGDQKMASQLVWLYTCIIIS